MLWFDFSIGFGSALSSVMGKLSLAGNPSDAGSETEAQRNSGMGERETFILFFQSSPLIN